VFVVSGQCAYTRANRTARTAARSKVEQDMPVEFLRGRPLSPEELDMLRQQIEEGFDNITEVDDEIRGIVARNCYRSFGQKKTDVPRKPQAPPQPITWTIYKVAAKQTRLGEVEAADEREAVEKAAKEFGQHATKLIAVRRQ
jgi:hypothetical protein